MTKTGRSKTSRIIDASFDIFTGSRRLGHASPAITSKIDAASVPKDDGKTADASDQCSIVRQGLV
jgi:hypothetical protein